MHVCLYVCMFRLSFHFRSTLPRLSTQFGRPHGAQVEARTLTLKIVPKVCCLDFDTSLLESSTNRVCSKLRRRLCVSNLTHPCSSLPSTTLAYTYTIVLTSMYVCMYVMYVCLYVCKYNVCNACNVCNVCNGCNVCNIWLYVCM